MSFSGRQQRENPQRPPLPWADIDLVKHVTAEFLTSRGDPELPPEESVAIVESICRDPGNSEILRFLCE